MARTPDNPRLVSFARLPKGVQKVGVARIEFKQRRGSVTDLVHISEHDWAVASWRAKGVARLIESRGPIGGEVKRLANLYRVSERTLRRWIASYRKDPDVIHLPRRKGPKVGHRRLSLETERLLTEVIDAWAARTERLPVSWIVEEFRRRARPYRLRAPSQMTVTTRLADRGLKDLSRRLSKEPDSGAPLPPNSSRALAIVQVDHTLVDIMVVDEIHRQSMGRPWITVVFDVATRVVLGFHLSLNAPSAMSVGLALAMAGLPKDRWLNDRALDVDWTMAGIPTLLHLNNGKDFHSLAFRRACERYGISVEYRPPGSAPVWGTY